MSGDDMLVLYLRTAGPVPFLNCWRGYTCGIYAREAQLWATADGVVCIRESREPAREVMSIANARKYAAERGLWMRAPGETIDPCAVLEFLAAQKAGGGPCHA